MFGGDGTEGHAVAAVSLTDTRSQWHPDERRDVEPFQNGILEDAYQLVR